MDDCLFCKILNGDVPSEKVYQGESVLGFKDISPQAKNHWLFIHKEHTKNINNMMESDPQQVVEVFQAIRETTQKEGLESDGFRVVTNLGPHAGQTVFHTHFHVLSGGQLGRFGAPR